MIMLFKRQDFLSVFFSPFLGVTENVYVAFYMIIFGNLFLGFLIFGV